MSWILNIRRRIRDEVTLEDRYTYSWFTSTTVLVTIPQENARTRIIMSQIKSLDLLFDPALIPSKVQSLLGDDLLLRPLASDDQTRGFFELLSVLTAAPKLSAQKFKDVFETLKRSNGIYYTIVIVHKASDKLVAAGTIVLEHKFIRNAGIVGHIEDIVVSRELQGRKLGLRIIDALGEIGAATGCYKIILDCDQKNVAFYEKCGYTNKGIQMAKYTSDPAGPKSPITPKL